VPGGSKEPDVHLVCVDCFRRLNCQPWDPCKDGLVQAEAALTARYVQDGSPPEPRRGKAARYCLAIALLIIIVSGLSAAATAMLGWGRIGYVVAVFGACLGLLLIMVSIVLKLHTKRQVIELFARCCDSTGRATEAIRRRLLEYRGGIISLPQAIIPHLRDGGIPSFANACLLLGELAYLPDGRRKDYVYRVAHDLLGRRPSCVFGDREGEDASFRALEAIANRHLPQDHARRCALRSALMRVLERRLESEFDLVMIRLGFVERMCAELGDRPGLNPTDERARLEAVYQEMGTHAGESTGSSPSSAEKGLHSDPVRDRIRHYLTRPDMSGSRSG